MSNVQAELNYDDFWLLDIEVDTLAKLKIIGKINEDTGETVLTPHLDPSSIKERYKKTKIIIAPDGSGVYPQSLYLVSKLRGNEKVKNTDSIAKALLLFTRFLDSTHSNQEDEDGNEIPAECLTYKSLSKYEEEGAPWRFAEFLKKNCRHRRSDGDEAWSLTTARAYMGAVLGFYKWMQKFGYLKNDDDHLVTHFSKGTYLYEGYDQHDMLTHTKSSTKREYEISNIMKEFPRADSTPIHKKLKPIPPEHLALFEEYIDGLPKPFALMFRLAIKTGTRIEELTHLPASNIGEADMSELDVIPIHLTKTKGSKPRNIEVPLYLYEELEQYKYSRQRERNALKRKHLFYSNSESVVEDYLFISNKGNAYSENTLEKHFSALRKLIQEVEPAWYYRVHDCRSTFATYWLFTESEARGVSYEFLMDELAELMGHESTTTTEKYIKFMNEYESKLRAAKRKNNKLNGGW
ncbi:tyrosine-type recombinase/integrase [Vibrio renipiscarius]|uniref:Integrase n=1 Tax=Vibrio renipiscarius TaxID=1461322 RepID=A0A0C2K933_9VIBR|nr:site-specific integrase [Vibrio renipiscarius]KII78538.1 integrase [Vibrio renipiscarius]KII78599.1 integrase [Vibrio renipiscarius]KII80541.1 integrase [Vibrio renipiscarius]KII81154.1 integrase [Vibrio renipiscarius]